MNNILIKKHRVIFLSIILFLLPTLTITHNLSENYQPVNQFNFDGLRISGVYENIVIDDKMTSNTINEGNWTWALSQMWCTGLGTPETPYIIEYETFVSTGGECLIIANSRKSFIIRNCVINSSDSAGLLLINVTNGKLLDNNIFNNQVGIVLFDVNETTISNNDVYNALTDGIFLQYSYSNTLSGNIVYNNSECGIDLKDSTFNNISGNTVYENSWSGIVDMSAIFIQNSDFNVLTENVIYNNSKHGIHLKTSDFNNLSRNTIYKNTEEGIYLQNSNSNAFFENEIYNNALNGIYLQDLSNDNNLAGNTLYNNTQHGIFLSRSDYNLIAGNEVRDNLDNGIHLYGDETSSDYNNITYNIIYKNDVGLYFEESCNQNNVINNILHNNFLGILIDDFRCNDNSISENIFLQNGIHAEDEGTSNNWNHTTKGNYWDNHTGPDTSPQDGIVDLQYIIRGSSASVDYLPIAEEGAPTITIISPKSGDTFGNSAPSFNVRIQDQLLDEMWYSIDGGLTNYTFTANGTIDQAAWDAISEGDVTLLFYANDILDNIGTESVTVIKSISSQSSIPGYNIFVLLGVLSVAIAIIKRTLKSKFT
jgi:parallel beta-helix repeat protein